MLVLYRIRQTLFLTKKETAKTDFDRFRLGI